MRLMEKQLICYCKFDRQSKTHKFSFSSLTGTQYVDLLTHSYNTLLQTTLLSPNPYNNQQKHVFHDALSEINKKSGLK